MLLLLQSDCPYGALPIAEIFFNDRLTNYDKASKNGYRSSEARAVPSKFKDILI
jgi:hypothetical protein